MLRTTITNIVISAIFIASVVGLYGCSGTATGRQTRLNQNWGRSFESALYNQTLNPEAGKNLEPVEGIDGSAAEGIVSDHLKGPSSGSKPSVK
ncbi:hypothetical protein [Desulfosarcina variabilis]|uniref:hypothetical protein n=1 Tax=Desulfosarcina variabilis TaxID=2300 RepID=UPI003AFA3686